MAYTATYIVHFTNEQNQDVLVTIYKKDGPAVDPVPEYMCTSLELSDKSEGQTKYDSTIICRELVMSIWSEITDEITWETFITAAHDDWFIDVVIDGQKYFEGFITPDEGNALFQDKPYEVTIRATNGLALLKDVELVDINGDQFVDDNTLIAYIAGALKQTGLSIPIRCRCSYFNSAMNDKVDSINNDMFGQAQLNYRSFQKDATTFTSCYDALKLILDKFCRLEYWNGYWQITAIGELQYVPDNYYVDYDANGENPVGAVETENYAQIGKAVDIYPINEDQQIYSRFAVKTAKTKYTYEVWPELPKNIKFDRGTQIDSGIATDEDDIDNDGNTSETIGTYKSFSIADWQYGKFTSLNVTFPFVPNSELAYRKSVYNTFGIEIARNIVLQNTTGSNNYLICEAIPVYSQDKFTFNFDFKHTTGGVNFGTEFLCRIYLYPTGNTNDPLWVDNNGFWRNDTVQSISHFYDNGEDSSKFMSHSVEPNYIPQDGTLYIMLVHTGSSGNRVYRNISFEYFPFVAGGYVQVKGDYWTRSQNATYPDKADEEVFISDSPKKLFKGAILVGGALTTPTWYRYGLAESKHFKEILNIARFNHSYRRMYAVEGSFNGLNFAPQNDQLNKQPIGFHKRYRLVDMAAQRDFVLVPELKMDLIKGWITANLVEVRKDTDGDTDGTQAGDSSSFNYIF